MGVVGGGGGAEAVPEALEDAGEGAEGSRRGVPGSSSGRYSRGVRAGLCRQAPAFEHDDGGPVEAVDGLAPVGLLRLQLGTCGPVL